MGWDYIVVGAGSAGCALTHELVRSGASVLVIEAGGRDNSPFIKVAAAHSRACAKHDWGYVTQPDPTRYGVVEKWTRGRVLGGSSSINGTMFVRGAAHDFDSWGIPGWSAQDVLPIFRQLESSDQPGPLRGHGGPLHVRTVKEPHLTTHAFVESVHGAGHPLNADYNGATQEGVGYAQLSQRRGFRCSAADAFLKPLLKRRNLKLALNAEVSRIETVRGRAVAVHFLRNGRHCRETARDIIICAGAISSPKLLMLSGIGDAQALERHGIDVVSNVPAVGRNLKEHPSLSISFRSKVPTYNLTEGPLQALKFAAQFLRSGEGPIANLFEGVAFLRSSSAEPVPDLKVLFLALSFTRRPDGRLKLAPYPSVLALVMKSYPLSAGAIRLASGDPRDPPVIESRLLAEQADVDTMVRGVEMTRELMRSGPLGTLLAEEIAPGQGVRGAVALQEFVRRNTGISFHPVGTCRMGAGAGSVVGPDLRVHGFENLWVADASIMPDHLSANTNAPCIMIGMKLGQQLALR